MAFAEIERLLREGRLGAAEELILAFSADASGEDLALLAGHLADLAGEYARLGRVEDSARARGLLGELAGGGEELLRARADVALINAWLDQAGTPEALELLRGMPGFPPAGGALPEGELQRLVLTAFVNILSALADGRDVSGAEELFGEFWGKAHEPANSDLMALAALNAVIVRVHAGRAREAAALAAELEGYGEGEETRRYCARASKIVNDLLDGGPQGA
ncbi:MAG: hypothetical protein LBW85_01850 [Deltaproteobacteria bacterium]|jgi:hypothetical protein|nr:hypothetical protein [Deltaproteobacteria bacterium]